MIGQTGQNGSLSGIAGFDMNRRERFEIAERISTNTSESLRALRTLKIELQNRGDVNATIALEVIILKLQDNLKETKRLKGI